MSIQPLPEDVIAQIKSSTTITSLNAVICGLVKNSLDAGATKLTVSVDYTKGNCSVEDNGSGILPAEFTPAGGLGKIYHTSRFPPLPGIHGHSGTFLASVAALSLLSLNSHHEGHRSHNSLQIHNSTVLARHTPSPPEQRLLTFSHGTRATVRDLFGSMPVRVKQRAAASDKTAHNRDWEQLKISFAALLLPWHGSVNVSMRDAQSQQSAIIRIHADALDGVAERLRRPTLTRRVSSVLYQAGLSGETSIDSWVTLKASTGQISIGGTVCLIPIATRRVQFISIGIQPLFNEYGSNVLYEEINRLFANSSFGLEQIPDLDDEEIGRRAQDRRYKSDGYTERELKTRKCVDRWPMFHVQIDFGHHERGRAGHDLEDILDERRGNLQVILDVLKAMFYEFLKKHHFRPMYYRPRKRDLTEQSGFFRDTGSGISSGYSTPTLPSRPASRSSSVPKQGTRPLGRDLSTTGMRLPSSEQQSRTESPFDGWTRIKSGRWLPTTAKTLETNLQAMSSREMSTESLVPNDRDEPSEPSLFNTGGDLVRPPFSDVEVSGSQDIQQQSDLRPEMGFRGGRPTVNDEIVWINPVSKQQSLVDARTGFITNMGADGTPSEARVHRLTSNKRLRTQPQESTHHANDWLKELLSTWKNPVFERAEPEIPVAFDEAKLTMSFSKSRSQKHSCHNTEEPSFSVEGRVSRESLREAEVIAQVDRKFILARIPLRTKAAKRQHPQTVPTLLVIIDQHAADERCRVEALMSEYFSVSEDETIQAQTEVIEKVLQYEISAQERLLFDRYSLDLRHWGIGYQLSPLPNPTQPSRTRLPSFLKVVSLPPSILERCQTEPRLLIDLLRKEIWKLDENGRTGNRHPRSTRNTPSLSDDKDKLHWMSRFHGCPQGVLDMINSRACRSAIMFNDPLSLEDCTDMLTKLAGCAFPFQCAHGRPSMIPLVDLGDDRINQVKDSSGPGFGRRFREWRMNM
ncbi:hypothetical protein JX265_010758 [Neoarthrinium moseri]|uniref:MutL C-terminal dimerisation domain-containing protein n=1 Tax=Neoarthrinium moseri TaxID=1658444 RepID=A0A9P9WDN0_9PEZI|nr:hypothetical protein JX265_010758 [Neoarthrinium moseri]